MSSLEYHPRSPDQHIIVSAEEALDLARKEMSSVVMKVLGVDISVDPETSTLGSILGEYREKVKALTDTSTPENSRLSLLRESYAEHAFHVADVEAFDLKNLSGILDWIDRLYELQNGLILGSEYARLIIYSFARNGFNIWNPYSQEATEVESNQKFRRIVGEALYLLYHRGHLNWEFICKLRKFRGDNGI